ncbi:ABC transporter substrate-binding protein [Microlunatus sp. Gsoil 973]|uniref:ABC transporter substrate-binding protein n=1 Tax=Microlunatus sp. Gsoil 973 TaxID=2672569 RepID=UPI0012B4EEB5|nr:ABC transporter substrate-binding protein [Microlunatus sp. Gsoil 973]QGN32282.1 transporter substrate-binding domain-containing protein [Microlunatus sp. Gsoil 973]
MSRQKILGVAVAVAALSLAACGSNSLSGGSDEPTGAASSAAAQPSQSADKALFDKLPDKIKSSKKIMVGSDASYAPNEFFAGDGSTIQGADVDLFNAVAAKLGVTAEYQNAKFETIILGVSSGKYDVGVSSFTINADRMKQVNMVSYYEAGTQWAEGSGESVDPDNACGKTIAVQRGTVQDTDDLPGRQRKCGGNKIKVLRFDGQDQATAAVVSGRADAMLADSPITQYAVKQSKGALKTVGDIYDAAPYGFVVPKDQTQFADVLAEALKEVKSDGSYDKALSKWGIQSGAIDDFAVNPKS